MARPILRPAKEPPLPKIQHPAGHPPIYASITRQDKQGKPEEGWFPDQKMSREQALRSYTLDAAYAAFQDQDKGSLEAGKLADITVLSKDILTIQPHEILDTEVLYTVVGGEVVYAATRANDSAAAN